VRHIYHCTDWFGESELWRTSFQTSYDQQVRHIADNAVICFVWRLSVLFLLSLLLLLYLNICCDVTNVVALMSFRTNDMFEVRS